MKKLSKLKTKEKTIAQKQMKAPLNNGDPLVNATKEKFLSMTINQQATWKQANKEAYLKLFSEDAERAAEQSK